VAVGNWLNRFPDLRTCGHATGERTAFEQIARLHPQLVLTEVLRPRDLGFIRKLHRRHPRLPILVFSHFDEEAFAMHALAAGARGFVMKGVDGDALVTGIRNALKGRSVISRSVAVRLIHNGNAR